jgi:hypothetical protein
MRARTRRVRTAAIVLAASFAAVACGQSKQSETMTVAGIPLAHGAHVVSHTRRCDRGTNPYCALQVVVAGPRYPSSAELLSREERRLRAAGWGSAQGDTIFEQAAESPNHKLRLTYATAQSDLQSYDVGNIKRAPSIARALSRQLFARSPALSLMVQTGSS